ncbi:MAG: hypothetical protein R3C12_20355 [Planctomycetaceae bacterium]
MVLSLATLTLATLLALIPPLAVKFVVDHVLGNQPLSAGLPSWVPRDPWPLLVAITSGVVLISFLKVALHVWGLIRDTDHEAVADVRESGCSSMPCDSPAENSRS